MENALGYIGWASQPDETTDEAPIFFIPWQTLTAPENIRMLTAQNGFNPDLSIARKAGQWTDYNLKTYLSPDAGASLLAYTLGGADTVTPGAPNVHNFQISDAQPPFLSVESSMGNGTIIQRIPGCRMQKSSLQMTGGQWVEYTAVIKGRQAIRQASAASVVFEGEDQFFTFLDGNLVFGSLSIDPFDVIEVKIDMDNTITPRQPVGNFAPRYLREKRVFQLDFKVLTPDDTLFRSVNWGDPTGTGPSRATTYLSSLVTTFALAPVSDNEIILTTNNVELEQAHSNWDVNAVAWQVDCMGKLIRATDPMVLVEAHNDNSSAYL